MKNCKTCNEYSCGAQGTNSVSEICGKRKSDNISPICEDAEERRMTREEAIAFFKDMNECTYGNLEAVEMAIKALEQKSVLDKIKENIQFIKDKCLPNNIAEEYEQKGLQEALDIIDKYREVKK